MRWQSVSFVVAAVALIGAACGPRQQDIERHLDRGRYLRALRTARRADDAGLRLAGETRVAEQLLRALRGELRITAEPPAAVSAALGSVPPAYAAGRALPLRLAIRVDVAESVPMSFRVLGLSHEGTLFLRTSECPPPEGVDIDCVEWLAGAPIVPPCERSGARAGDRAAAGIMRWMSGGLVNVPTSPREAPVCAREPVEIPPTQRPEVELAARRLHELLAAPPPPRVTPGGQYIRRELLYESSDRGEASALFLQVAFHVDRRAAPLRYTGRIPLPGATTPASGLATAFERPLPLSRVFRVAAPAGAHGR